MKNKKEQGVKLLVEDDGGHYNEKKITYHLAIETTVK